jgi:hypothetical protein
MDLAVRRTCELQKHIQQQQKRCRVEKCKYQTNRVGDEISHILPVYNILSMRPDGAAAAGSLPVRLPR